MISFRNLKLINPIIRAITEAGYSKPTEIQNAVIPVVLKGNDLLAYAPKGSGKIAAFAVPILQLLNRNPAEHMKIRVLILASTDELVVDIERKLILYSKYVTLLQLRIHDGSSKESQASEFKRRIDVLLATPERLFEIIDKMPINFSKLEMLVLYDVDKMDQKTFKIGMKNIQEIIPTNVQTLVFCEIISNTVKKSVSVLLNNPKEISTGDSLIPIKSIKQSVYFVENRDKQELLIYLVKKNRSKQSLVFIKNKYIADNLLAELKNAGIITESIHGNTSTAVNNNILDDFKNGKIQILISTDSAIKGLFIGGLSNIVNYDFPDTLNVYIERTERIRISINDGSLISFCTANEHLNLHDIQNRIGFTIPVGIL